MPAQPPFFTPTRRPAIGFSDAEMISCTRAAAASVRVITLNLELFDPIRLSFNRVQGPANDPRYSNGLRGLTERLTAADRSSPGPANRPAARRRPFQRPQSPA